MKTQRPTPLEGPFEARRDATIERLHAAVGDGDMSLDEFSERVELATHARTGAELTALVADLPSADIVDVGDVVETEVVAPVPAVRSQSLATTEPKKRRSKILAIFGSASRKGQWELPRRLKATAVFGGVKLDLREAIIAPGVSEIRCLAVFGGIELEVPAGVRVECEGIAIFGEFDNDDTHGPYADDAPTVRITGTAVFGGVDVDVSKRRKRSRKRVDVDSDSDLKKLPRR